MTKTREITAQPFMGTGVTSVYVEQNPLRVDYAPPNAREVIAARVRELEARYPLFKDAPIEVLQEFNQLCRRLLELPRGAG